MWDFLYRWITQPPYLTTLVLRRCWDATAPERLGNLRRLELAVADCQVQPGDIVRNIHPLSVPQFSLMSELVLQADRRYQMPWSITGAVIAEDWGATCGFDFVYGLPDPPLMHDRKVGLAKIRGDSESANPSTTGAKTVGYVLYVGGCLFHARDIANKLANEAPAGLFAD
jgi:hypothetical protein